MKKYTALFLPLFFAILPCILANAQAQQDHFSTAALAKLLLKVDTIRQQGQMPGLMISIVAKDRIAFSTGLGYADVEQKIPVDSTTQFHLASISKFFVAMGIQKLVTEGKLNLNDRLRDIAPEVPYTNTWESSHPIRLVHLLEHTAGFEDIALNKMVNVSGKPLTGIDAIVDQKNALTSRWRPGEMMAYSNPGYNVLGYIIEKVSGKPWDAHIQQTLFKPLGMHSTLFDLRGESRATYAKGYDFRNGKHMLLPFYTPSSNGASSALVSSAADMSKFLHYLVESPRYSSDSLLNNQALTEMEKVHSTLASRNGLQTGYALGNDLFPNNKKVTFRGHNGKGEGFSSWIFFNRKAGLAYAISTNCNTNLWPISEVVEDFLTKNMAAPEMYSIKVDSAKTEPLLGYYQFTNPKNERWEFYKKIFGGINLLSIDGDKLIIDKGRGQIDSLIHMGNGIFRLQGDIIASCIIGQDNEGRSFFQGYGNSFYRKTAYAPILVQKTLIYLGLLAALLSIIYAIVAIPLAIFKKISFIDLCSIVLPALGILCFLWAYRLLGSTDATHKELFATANTTSISIFADTLFFAISIATSAYLLYRGWSRISNTWLKFAFAFNTLFLLYLVALLSIHGWIGIPIWSM
ncbi:serine hydrolase domain-containing protein [Sphingobacterium paludis]|uniref:CubicO group peptidase (Beta-lactamase class C family) n=1 Tax=Sphingobacterium paludis TaxID=1476465 RepID=A0A4R7CZ73_9SPHI|nr:serine hydrolase domain-containing protein [Sphingobacterium paludis]TDS12474.1 CubicO group peptidase (beta-lactamase class C family) [Sphingobacterium paludis]